MNGGRLGPYEVLSKLGEGGMGAVYRATDTSLGRQVALKVLPDAFAQDAERLARFEREARTLAALNHPNIATIYAVEKSGGTTALVMELVEGDDLSQRIARGAAARCLRRFLRERSHFSSSLPRIRTAALRTAPRETPAQAARRLPRSDTFPLPGRRRSCGRRVASRSRPIPASAVPIAGPTFGWT